MEITRRSFSAGLAGLVGALLVPWRLAKAAPSLIQAAPDLSLLKLRGRLATEPLLKPFLKRDGSWGHRAFFRLAVAHAREEFTGPDGKAPTNYIPVICWGEKALEVGEHTRKGSKVEVQGHLVEHCMGGESHRSVDIEKISFWDE